MDKTLLQKYRNELYETSFKQLVEKEIENRRLREAVDDALRAIYENDYSAAENILFYALYPNPKELGFAL